MNRYLVESNVNFETVPQMEVLNVYTGCRADGSLASPFEETLFMYTYVCSIFMSISREPEKPERSYWSLRIPYPKEQYCVRLCAA